MPEFIATRDGAEKQDCERHAVKRWFGKHRARLAPLRPVYLGDDLFACHPVARMVTDAGDDFIFTAKETSHKALYDFIAGAELSSHEEKARRRATKETFRYRWFEAVPIREAKDPILVNWIGLELVDDKGKVKYSMAWVTSLPAGRRGETAVPDRRLRPQGTPQAVRRRDQPPGSGRRRDRVVA